MDRTSRELLFALVPVGMFLYLLLRWIVADERYAGWWDNFVDTVLNIPDQAALWLRERWDSHRLRRKAGRCLKCGYNLYRNTSGVCPECGTPIHENRP